MMLERIQQSLQGPVMKALLFIIIIFFIFAGYFSAGLFGGDPDQVAEVEGNAITNAQVQQRYDNLRVQLGDNFDQQYATEASQAVLRQQILEQLINERVLRSNIEKAGFTASKEQITEWIRNFPQFQISGEYSAAQAKTILQQSGMTEESFRSYAIEQITRNQLNSGINSSGFSLNNEIESLYRLQEQTRDVKVLRVAKEKFLQVDKVSEDEINNYYQQNQAEFEQPEMVNLNYVRLSINELTEKEKLAITEQHISDYYELNKADYQSPKEIQVAHILIDNSVDDAKEKAEGLLKQIQEGADFAELAKEHSSDSFSGENGGVLDWTDAVAKSDTNPDGTGWVPEFEAAALALKNIGDMTGLVETQFGFHIIKLLAERGGDSSPLADVSDRIKETLALEKAEKTFYEKQTVLNEKLFEYGDSIEAFAQQVELPIQETGLFSADTATGLASNPVILEKAFSSSVLNSSEVSDKVDLGNNDIVYLVVKEYKAADVKPLEEVKPIIVTKLAEQKADDDSKAFADKVLASVESGEDISALLTEKEFTWQENNALTARDSAMDFDLISAVFKVTPAQEGSAFKVEQLFNGDYAVVELKGVAYPDVTKMDEATKQQLKQRLNYANSQGELRNLLKSFRENTDIKQ